MRLGMIAAAAFFLLSALQAMAQYYPYVEPYRDNRVYEYDDPYYAPEPAPEYEYDRAPQYERPQYGGPQYRPAPYRRHSQTQGAAPGTILIATSAHTLYYTDPSGQQFAYPIAVGREGKQWFGTTRVVSKKEYPEWRPTAEMRRKNPRLPAVVKPGPSNPLGTRAIYLADGLLRIHGTNDPSSIGRNASSGCFRMYREDVEHLYEIVQPGTQVVVER